MLKISEKDLYDYVMHPENLSLDKTRYICDNIDKYIDEIVFLEAFKENLNMKVSQERIDKIHKKINEQNKTVKVLLKQIKKVNNSEYLTLAADSPWKETSVVAKTFQDDKRDNLLKLITTEKQSKIFLFGSYLDENADYTLILNPSGDRLNFDLLEQPLITAPIYNIESIELSFKSNL